MKKYYCDVFEKTFDADFHKECHWELGKVPNPEKVCFDCERYKRIQNEKKIRIATLASDLSSNPKTKKIKPQKRLRKQIKYEPFERTRSQLYTLAFIMIIEGHLKYMKDPEGMLDDPEHRIFAIPFLDYAKGEISFSEADRRVNTIRSVVPLDLAEIWHMEFLRMQHEKISGGDLSQDIYSLQNQDEKTSRDAALRIVKSFPETQFKFPGIKNVIARAIVDEDFFEAFDAISSKRNLHAKRDLKLLSFKIRNEEALNDPDLTETDVRQMADKQGLDYKSNESLLKYLRREGIKIRSTEQSQHTPLIKAHFEKDVIKQRRSEFKKYLFGDTSIQQIKQGISSLKKSLKIK
jgi:hypothetical protein